MVAGVDLGADEVLESLVIGRPDKDLGLEHLPGESVVHGLVAVPLEAVGMELFA